MIDDRCFVRRLPIDALSDAASADDAAAATLPEAPARGPARRVVMYGYPRESVLVRMVDVTTGLLTPPRVLPRTH